MEEMTWKEIFFGNKSLKQMREENNLNIPEEYTESSKKITLFFGGLLFVSGTLLGYGIANL